MSTNAGASFADIAGATGSSYTTPATVAGDNGNRYRVIANNAVGSATSNAATLTVAVPAAPNFTTHPASVTITEGQNTQFTVAVSGAPTPTLQWQLSTDSGGNWSNITGETGATFTALNVALGNNGRQFRAVATNSAGTTNSNAAVLTVTAVSPVTITTSSPLPTGTVNVAYSVTLTASGGTPPYTWTVVDGYTLPSFLTLNASTGQISGTPTAVAGYGWAIRVTDSANPQQSNQTNFELYVETPCDTDFGSATVAGAPNTVEGKFCPQTSIAPGSPNAYGMVTAAWQETYPYGGGSYRENVGVTFHLATGQVNSVAADKNSSSRPVSVQRSSKTRRVTYLADHSRRFLALSLRNMDVDFWKKAVYASYPPLTSTSIRFPLFKVKVCIFMSFKRSFSRQEASNCCVRASDLRAASINNRSNHGQDSPKRGFAPHIAQPL